MAGMHWTSLARKLLFKGQMRIFQPRRATPILVAIAAFAFALQSLSAMPADEEHDDNDLGSQTRILYDILKEAHRLTDVIRQLQDQEAGASLSRLATKEARATLEQLFVDAVPETGGPPFHTEVYEAFQRTPEFQIVKEVSLVFQDDADLNSLVTATETHIAQDPDPISRPPQQTATANKRTEPDARFEELAKAMLALPLERPPSSIESELDWILKTSVEECEAPKTIQLLEDLKEKVNSSESLKRFACSVAAYLRQSPSKVAWRAALTLNEVIGLDPDDFLVDEIPEFKGNHVQTLGKILAAHDEARRKLLNEVGIERVGEIQSVNPSKLFQGTEADFARRAVMLFSMAKLEYQGHLLVESRQRSTSRSLCK